MPDEPILPSPGQSGSKTESRPARPWTGGSVAAGVVAVAGATLLAVLLCKSQFGPRTFSLLLLLLTMVCLYLNGPSPWILLRRSGLFDQPDRDTPRTIALALLVFFGAALGFTGMAAASQDASDVAKEWLDLFKSGFLLLGGGLTTVIGYYFGSRETAKAVKQAENTQVRINQGIAAERSEGTESSAADTKPRPITPLRSRPPSAGGGTDPAGA